ncbi:MAG: response regulator transcription factor [Edaphobacter sp.]|uniref:response regulator n=1 Tax=Edaphobacter sp. TaxID=1934404 RepID=UPI002398DF44|nr:response regulator transcription factor [Edaphobacter sp.]MDE1178200.1 response regulator transcription factor [Edaphobacter sp.]
MPSGVTRVLLADDHAIVRRGLALILEADSTMELAGEAQDGNETLRLTAELKPDIVVMDISMAGMNGIECTRLLTERHPSVKVLVLSMHRDPVYVREAMRVGARGYLLKDDTEENLLSAIRNIARGNAFLSPAVAGVIVTDFRKHVADPLDLLTTREREVLYLIAEGMTNKEAAKRLNLSVYTIEAHRSRVMEKLNLQSSVDLVRFAMRQGLIL